MSHGNVMGGASLEGLQIPRLELQYRDGEPKPRLVALAGLFDRLLTESSTRRAEDNLPGIMWIEAWPKDRQPAQDRVGKYLVSLLSDRCAVITGEFDGAVESVEVPSVEVDGKTVNVIFSNGGSNALHRHIHLTGVRNGSLVEPLDRDLAARVFAGLVDSLPVVDTVSAQSY